MVDDSKSNNNKRNPWESDAIEKWPLSKLRGYPANPRAHPRENLDAIKKSIVEFGWVNPIIVDEVGEIVAGHGRAIAAAELGIVKVPVIVARGWSPERLKAFRIADNAIPEQALWNIDLLKVELADLAHMNFPLEIVGFPDVTLAEFVTGFGDGAAASIQASANKTLAEQFGIPPFTVLNARAGWWQVRKAAWIALGMQPELGRKDAEA